MKWLEKEVPEKYRKIDLRNLITQTAQRCLIDLQRDDGETAGNFLLYKNRLERERMGDVLQFKKYTTLYYNF